MLQLTVVLQRRTVNRKKGAVLLHTVISCVVKPYITFAIIRKMMDYINQASKIIGIGFSQGKKNKPALERSCNFYLCNKTLINDNKLHVLQNFMAVLAVQRLTC